MSLGDRFKFREITTEVVWGSMFGYNGVGVLAKVFDSVRGEELSMVLTEQQLSASLSRNSGEPKRQIEAALEAIKAESELRNEGGSALYGPLSVLGRGPGH